MRSVPSGCGARPPPIVRARRMAIPAGRCYHLRMNVTDDLRVQAAEIARSHGLRLVLLFGSVAAGTARPDSDVDVAVRFGDPRVRLGKLLDVQRDLSAVFPRREIDLAVIDRADPLFLKKIAERFVVLFGERREVDAFRLMAFRRYQDHRKYLGMERDYVAAYVRRIAS